MDIVKYTKDNTFQNIKAWYIDENSVKLSPVEEERKDRMKHIWALRSDNKYSRRQTIKIVVRDHNVSQATAYRDYTMSMELFGSIEQVDIAAERMILAESYWNLYQMAMKKGLEETALKALAKYQSLYNFQDTAQKVDPKKLEASNYILKLPRNANKMLTEMFKSGVMDFNNLAAEDVSFQEVDETIEEEEDDE